MNFLVIGLGSMGKRRVRCLQALGYEDILGFDFREDRREEAETLYGIQTIANVETIHSTSQDAWIISTPPDKHNEYMNLAVDAGIPAFVEASVILEGLEEIDARAKEKNVLIAPSCTFRLHPLIRETKEIVRSGKYGKVTNFSYHCGQYLPDWHPWEDVRDFYVSKKETGACREIVPFELTWLVDIVGYPENIIGFYGKTMDVGADIDDTYVISLKCKESLGILLVDVVSRYATRNFLLNLEYGQITWRWDEPVVRVYDAHKQRWITYGQQVSQAHQGYNKNIGENMYIEEMQTFIQAVKEGVEFPNSLEDDINVLRLLHRIEERKEAK
jgi:predicted dehydrogenase